MGLTVEELEGLGSIRLNDFSALKGRFSGALFIIASGPSVNQFPMQWYRNVPMIAVNGSIMRFVEEGVKPLFYLCDDKGVAARKGLAVATGIRLSANAALSRSAFNEVAKHSPEVLSGENLYLLERVNRAVGHAAMTDRRFAWSVRNNPDFAVEWSLFRQKPNRIGFSRNMANGYFNGRTIAYAALQVAYHLGFDKVFLVGVDMTPEAGQFYDPKGEIVPSRLGDDYEEYIFPSFALMARKIVSSKFAVYNLSKNSRIPDDLIPKINYEQVDRLLAAK
ncbi:lipopolysaccharide core biosynthesis protein [Stutzerimonas stutzeri]|uniref:lipopolysaccharide core biosynthesis protein n=1 Tax=Stutzerimonas sp. S1 TaxID=3030652 RepID=UPI0022242CA0|nr:lipopolysaccharide core biosynthesis protein [Stutzerimonas sp. S1]MCW3147355.1 lipopolysaccharide core biosynthesis protein [Stutzerimonas sp. S1]